MPYFFIPNPVKEVDEGKGMGQAKREISETRENSKQIVASRVSSPHPQLVLIKETPVKQLNFLLFILCSGPAS